MTFKKQTNSFLNGDVNFMVTGENGAGKSVYIESVVEEAIKREIIFSYMPQSRGQIWSLKKTLKILFLAGIELIPKSEIKKLISRFDASKIYSKNISKLSDGQVMIIQLIEALSIETNLFILDEFTNGLDKFNKKIVIDLIYKMSKSGKNFLICSHDKDIIKTLKMESICIKKVKNV